MIWRAKIGNFEVITDRWINKVPCNTEIDLGSKKNYFSAHLYHIYFRFFPDQFEYKGSLQRTNRKIFCSYTHSLLIKVSSVHDRVKACRHEMVRMFLLQLRKSRFAPVCFLAATLSTAGLLTVQIDQVLSINHVIIDVIGPTLMTNVWFLWARYSLLTSPSNTTSLQVQTLTDWFFYWVDHRASYKHSL